MRKGFCLGDGLCLLGAASESMHLFRLRALASDRFPAIQLQAAKTALGAALCGVWLAADLGTGRAHFSSLWPGWANPLAWGILLFAALVPGAVADVCCARAITKVSATTADVILSTECVFAALIAFLLLGERLGSRGLSGAGLLMAAALLAVGAESGQLTLAGLLRRLKFRRQGSLPKEGSSEVIPMRDPQEGFSKGSTDNSNLADS
jgi:drug/metabolite transporter (DMT)-like permease